MDFRTLHGAEVPGGVVVNFSNVITMRRDEDFHAYGKHIPATIITFLDKSWVSVTETLDELNQLLST